MYASWAISNGGVVVMIGRRLWWLNLNQSGKLPMRIKDITEKKL